MIKKKQKNTTTSILKTSDVAKNYTFLGILIGSMILGGIAGIISPTFAKNISFLGTIFINLMFCIVVPLVFASISSSIANMKDIRRAGKIIGITIAIFIITGAIAAIIMFCIMKVFPPVLKPWEKLESESIGEYASITNLIINFLTSNDFVGLLSRRAMLPLIVFSVLFGFSTNMVEKGTGIITTSLDSLAKIMVKFVAIITYYAPIAFFAIFAGLTAQYGPQMAGGYARAMIAYYPLCFIYLFTAFPLFAWFGGGKGAIKVMFSKLARPTIVSLGTCSSIATIPTNMHVAEETGISKDVSNIVLPLGATMHMDGSCFSCVLKIAFVLGIFGEQLTWDKLIPIVLVAVFSSVGMSGVPGGGYIGEYIICVIFFPEKVELAFPVLVAIGNLVDPPATMINAAGDYVVSFIVSRYVDGKDWLQKKLKLQKLTKLIKNKIKK